MHVNNNNNNNNNKGKRLFPSHFAKKFYRVTNKNKMKFVSGFISYTYQFS